MDKSILKKFAIESRKMLMTAVENQLNKFYVDEELEKVQTGDLIILKNANITLQPLTIEEFNKRVILISRIRDLSEDGSFESGKKRVIEETAYTWFNRIIAIRYMELNDMLPLTKDNQSLGIRALSSINNESHPEILKLGNLTNTGLDLKIDFDKYNKFLNENEQFNYILKLICNKLSVIIPQVFDGLTDYIDLLLPDNLLSDNGFVTKVIKEVPENNFKEGVEIIGWLYQYYNQTEKDRVINAKKQYKKNEIAYATQLFTPDWIVKYMVENSLGRIWIEHNGDEELIKNWKYFINNNIKNQKEKIKVTEIKFIDPCCGSGHILVYAFEIFYQIYKEQGYNKNDIPEEILSNNLFGLDIDDRAWQLSILSVILKAREYDNNIFNKNIIQNLNIYSIQETSNINKSDLSLIKTDSECSEIIDYLYDTFLNAKEIGSLLIVKKLNYDSVIEKINELANKQLNFFDIEKIKIINEKIRPILNIAKILSEKYEVVVTNPPYMNNSVMTPILKDYVVKNYSQVKSDLFSAFVIKNINMSKKHSYLGYMTPYVWMFILSYESLRKTIIDNYDISSLIQMEYSALEEATVPICSFVLKNDKTEDTGFYYRLTTFLEGMKVQEEKFIEINNNNDLQYIFKRNESDFLKIPGYPLAYWMPKSLLDAFEKKSLKEYANIITGMTTGNNNKYLKMWYEINYNKISFKMEDYTDIGKTSAYWYPYSKGGERRKWYGNYDYVVNWNCSKEFNRSKTTLKHLYFKKAITWPFVTSGSFSARVLERGFLWDVAGSPCFVYDDKYYKYILGFLNTNIADELLHLLNPTINVQAIDLAKVPLIIKDEYLDEINNIVDENLSLSKKDWDSVEYSWNFQKTPLLIYNETRIEEAYKKWEKDSNGNFMKMKKNEEKLNEIFINIYNLNDNYTNIEEEKDVTIRKADKEREIKYLISYAVGCMFGRYSLDEDGLVYAGGTFDKSRYKTYEVDLDNAIPITDEKYFTDDIVERFKNFIEIAYGKETFKENINYIADALGRKNNEEAEDTIRRYFVNDFYKDHIKTYQKKPIYWMLESGKNNGFKCLIYMHRYDENIVAKIRMDYLYKVQRIYESRLQEIKADLEDSSLSNYDVKKLEKEQENLQIKLEEIKKYNDKLSTIGDKRISIDLDDGVTENYKKFTYIDPLTNKESSILAEAKTIIPKKK